MGAINDFIGIIIDSLNNLINFLLPIAGIIIVGVLIYGGIQYITGGAKGGEIGKKTIIAGLIGLIIIVLAWAIINFVVNELF